MGRAFDGGYAEYVVVPSTQVIPFTSNLPWDVIGSVPDTLRATRVHADAHRDIEANRISGKAAGLIPVTR
ncbi:hypothetical protein [Actinoplanes sp. NPDC020271]|uniref:hypothetical protein n=1 Tax=Actinoplanes sp. NPDC020271 TaxID=3363896 RepID=UPI0037B2CBB6